MIEPRFVGSGGGGIEGQAAGSVKGWKKDMLAKIDVVIEYSSGMEAKRVAFK